MNDGDGGRESVPSQGILGQESEKLLFDKNQARTIALSDLWMGSLRDKIMGIDASEERRLEVMFMITTNSILDIFMGLMAEDGALDFPACIDEYLKVALVNQKYGTDLMADFHNDFVEEKGNEFDSEEQLNQALETFEAVWFATKRFSLKNRSPDRALNEMGEKYSI